MNEHLYYLYLESNKKKSKPDIYERLYRIINDDSDLNDLDNKLYVNQIYFDIMTPSYNYLPYLKSELYQLSHVEMKHIVTRLYNKVCELMDLGNIYWYDFDNYESSMLKTCLYINHHNISRDDMIQQGKRLFNNFIHIRNDNYTKKLIDKCCKKYGWSLFLNNEFFSMNWENNEKPEIFYIIYFLSLYSLDNKYCCASSNDIGYVDLRELLDKNRDEFEQSIGKKLTDKYLYRYKWLTSNNMPVDCSDNIKFISELKNDYMVLWYNDDKSELSLKFYNEKDNIIAKIYVHNKKLLMKSYEYGINENNMYDHHSIFNNAWSLYRDLLIKYNDSDSHYSDLIDYLLKVYEFDEL